MDSITVFSKCHHGWAYHPSEANEQHPGLAFDLLGEMIGAAHAVGVKTPVYLSAGLDEKLARRHPEWLIRDIHDQTRWVKDFMTPGYHEFCFNTPYLDILLAQIEEVATRYDADGIFLDIVGVRRCYCQYCVAELRRNGQDPRDLQAVAALGRKTYMNYTDRVRKLVHSIKPSLPIFHNSGHQVRGRRELAHANTHLELESLPTGGWGYDHFPLSARYAQTLGMDVLGMTGKFHQAWGEFGGYKHPNALRFETALSLAHGAGCSIGDQLHPRGLMDPATYSLIGEAYAEVEAKEPWCRRVSGVADVAVLSLEAAQEAAPPGKRNPSRNNLSDAGAVRILTECHYLFDMVDMEADFHAYKVLVLPDEVLLWPELTAKINSFIARGGKVLATGRSGLDLEEEAAFVLELGVTRVGKNPYCPDYFRPDFTPGPLKPAAFVMYAEGQQVELAPGGRELGRRENPYFNRDVFTFCSHQHTPTDGEYGGPGMVESDSGIYIAWNVFADYADQGHLILKEMAHEALQRLLPRPMAETGLPARGIITLQHQKEESRYIQHMLYNTPVKKGRVEVIEDIVPLYNIPVTMRLPEPVKRVYLAPQGTELTFTVGENGQAVSFILPLLENHQMIVLDV